MPINIANVQLTNSFDNWRTTTNQIIDALKTQVVLQEQLDLNSLSPFPVLLGAASLDSLEIPAVPLAGLPLINGYLTGNTITINDSTKIGNFKVGQKMKIYGAKSTAINPTGLNPPSIVSAITNGFPAPTPTTASSYTTFTYKLAQFDYTGGRISGATGDLQAVSTNSPVKIDAFNDTNNVGLTFTRDSITNGVLVYRSASGVGLTRNYALVAVLGPKDLPSLTSTWVDYYDYDYTVWSKKNIHNEFTQNSGLIHFPITPTANRKLGWADAEISFVDTTLARIKFTSDYNFESNIVISHNDTELVQNAINARDGVGAKSLELSTKVYIVEGLDVPNDFAIIGNGGKTVLRKMSWSSSTSETGNRLLKSSTQVNDFNITDVVLDGNMQNQYLLSETNDEKANYLVDVRGDTSRYENIKLISAIGGGINASDSTSVSMVSSFIVDSNLSDLYAYPPVDVTGSSDVVLSSNIFRNFSGSVEASVVNGGSIVGNVVKNCGSGLVIYGSTNLISSPNILIGPAGEFLPSPDILNSEYDSVNITLEPNNEYESDIYVYQENGTGFNLNANRATLFHRIDKLEKNSTTGVESLYGNEVLIASARPMQPALGPDASIGQFAFTISQQNVDVLLSTYSYSALKGSGAGQNPNHVGLVYRSMLTEYVPRRTVNTDVPLAEANNVSRTITANTLGVNTTAQTIKVTNNNANSQLNFNIGDLVYYNLPSTNTAVAGLSANTKYYVSFANSTDVALSTTYNGSNINITEIRTTNPAESHSLNKTMYFVKVNAGSNTISVGNRVRFLSHDGGAPESFNTIIGTITNINASTGVCAIAYDPTINITTVGSGGTLTVENTFVLAKGRIL